MSKMGMELGLVGYVLSGVTAAVRLENAEVDVVLSGHEHGATLLLWSGAGVAPLPPPPSRSSSRLPSLPRRASVEALLQARAREEGREGQEGRGNPCYVPNHHLHRARALPLGGRVGTYYRRRRESERGREKRYPKKNFALVFEPPKSVRDVKPQTEDLRR